MSEQAWPEFGTIPDPRHDYFSLVGTGGSVPTVVQGLGFTLTRNSAGNITMQWSEFPGAFHSWDASLRATTQSALAGFTVVAGAWDATNWKITFVLYNTSQVATDLAALQWIDGCVNFKKGVSAP